MKYRDEIFLLCILWLIGICLMATFWFSAIYGFNILSSAHWAYIGILQASGTPVNPMFYVWMIVFILAFPIGLYFIISPKMKFKSPEVKPAPEIVSQVSQEVIPQNRPPRPIMPRNWNPAPVQPIVAKVEIPLFVSDSGLEDILKSKNYVPVSPPKIKNFRPSVFALGADEVIYFGGRGIEPKLLDDYQDELQELFVDTLDELPIKTFAFTIGDYVYNNEVEVYKDDADMMAKIPMTKPDLESDEEFRAYMEYIDTARGYFDKK